MNKRILFLVLSVVTKVERNYISATNSSNQIEILLETLIQKVDLLEKWRMFLPPDVDGVNTVVSKVEFTVFDLVTDVDNVKMKMVKGPFKNDVTAKMKF